MPEAPQARPEMAQGGKEQNPETGRRRILLKLSGEAFCSKDGSGIEAEAVNRIGSQIEAGIRATKAELAMVVGGGNILRGKSISEQGIERTTADFMGMLATIINALALQSALESRGIPTRVQSAINVADVCEPFIRRRAIRHLEKGRVVIFAGGTGNPYFTTDTTAALRAVEIGASQLLKATNVDGVYSDDPHSNPDAKLYKHISFQQVLRDQLKVMDQTAFILCMENHLPILVFNMNNIERGMGGDRIGTLVDD